MWQGPAHETVLEELNHMHTPRLLLLLLLNLLRLHAMLLLLLLLLLLNLLLLLTSAPCSCIDSIKYAAIKSKWCCVG
jgi:hypothetical protein